MPTLQAQIKNLKNPDDAIPLINRIFNDINLRLSKKNVIIPFNRLNLEPSNIHYVNRNFQNIATIMKIDIPVIVGTNKEDILSNISNNFDLIYSKMED